MYLHLMLPHLPSWALLVTLLLFPLAGHSFPTPLIHIPKAHQGSAPSTYFQPSLTQKGDNLCTFVKEKQETNKTC